jgi:hypothetical protein
MWRSLVAHLNGVQGAADASRAGSSNPVIPTLYATLLFRHTYGKNLIDTQILQVQLLSPSQDGACLFNLRVELFWGCSSFGRALDLHSRCGRFESCQLHCLSFLFGAVAHLGERLLRTQEVVGSTPISSIVEIRASSSNW